MKATTPFARAAKVLPPSPARARLAAKERGSAPSGTEPQDVSPQKQRDTNTNGAAVQPGSIRSGIDIINATLEAAAKKAGTDINGFRKLPISEQNAFLADARGAAKAAGSAPSGEAGTGSRDSSLVREVPLDLIDRSPFNREHFDRAKSSQLIESIKRFGVLQPGIARPSPKNFGRFELVAGERRWFCAGEAGLKTMPLKILQLTDEECIERQAEENLQREDLNPLDEAIKYQQFIEVCEKRGMKPTAAVDHVAKRLQRSKSTIYESMRLLKLPQEVKEAIWSGELPASHAKLLGELEHNREVQIETAQRILKPKKNDGLTDDGKVMGFRAAKDLCEEQKERIDNLAEYNKTRDQFIKKGNYVLTAKENEECFPEAGSYFDAESWITIDGWHRESSRYWRDLLKESKPNPCLAQDGDGKPLTVYRLADAIACAVKNGFSLTQGTARSDTEKNETRKKRLRAKIRREAWSRSLDALVAAVERGGDTETFLRFVAGHLLGRIISSSVRADQVVDRRGIAERGNKHRSDSILRSWVESGFNQKQLRGIIVESIAWNWVPYDFSQSEIPPGFCEACKLWKVDPKAIEAQLQASGKED